MKNRTISIEPYVITSTDEPYTIKGSDKYYCNPGSIVKLEADWHSSINLTLAKPCIWFVNENGKMLSNLSDIPKYGEHLLVLEGFIRMQGGRAMANLRLLRGNKIVVAKFDYSKFMFMNFFSLKSE